MCKGTIPGVHTSYHPYELRQVWVTWHIAGSESLPPIGCIWATIYRSMLPPRGNIRFPPVHSTASMPSESEPHLLDLGVQRPKGPL